MLGGAVQSATWGGEGDDYIIDPKGTTYVTNTTTGGADEFRAAETDLHDIDFFGSGSVFGSHGAATARWGMYTLITIDDDTFTAELYVRPGTTSDVPFELYATYGFMLSE